MIGPHNSPYFLRTQMILIFCTFILCAPPLHPSSSLTSPLPSFSLTSSQLSSSSSPLSSFSSSSSSSSLLSSSRLSSVPSSLVHSDLQLSASALKFPHSGFTFKPPLSFMKRFVWQWERGRFNQSEKPLLRTRRGIIEDAQVEEEWFFNIIIKIYKDRLFFMYLMVTASFFVLAFSGCICQALLNPPILLVEEEPNAPLLPGSLSTCQVQSMPPPQNCTYVYVRLRLGGWSREFMIGRDAMMCEFIHHDKRRNRFYIRGPMFKKMYRTPTYVMPDQKSLLIQMVMRRSDPITVPPPSVRLRLENAEPAAGLFVYSVEMFIPNLRMTVTYPVYTALYGGTNERIDALFKQTSIVQGSPTSPPTYGLTYFDIGFFCYMYSTLCFFMTSFFPVLKATVEMRTSDLFKQAIMASSLSALCTGAACLLYVKWVRINYVLSSASFSWCTIRCLYMNMLSIVSNVLGLYGVSKFIFAQDKYTKPFQKTAIIKLIGLTNAFVFFWLLIGLLINLRNTDQLRFLRSRVSEHPHSKDSKSKEASSRKKAPKETLVTAAGPEEPTETVGKTKSKEVSLKDLVAKQIAGREAPLAKLTEFAKTSKESLGNDYYNAMTAKGKVTSISQYFSGVPKQDREVKIKSAALPGLKPDPALRAMAEEMQQKTIKKTKSTASVGSTGSDYYAAMIKEGKIPKIGSISQYGALLK